MLEIPYLTTTSFTLLIMQVFPYHPWNGYLASKYTTPPDEASQSDCYYPSCDIATPPFVPVYKGMQESTIHNM